MIQPHTIFHHLVPPTLCTPTLCEGGRRAHKVAQGTGELADSHIYKWHVCPGLHSNNSSGGSRAGMGSLYGGSERMGGVERGAVGWSGVERGVVWSRDELNGMVWCGVDWSGVEWRGVMWGGVG